MPVPRNNRNILECKLFRNDKRRNQNREIIETYWNVNGCLVLNELHAYEEIIETYWNVNSRNLMLK